MRFENTFTVAASADEVLAALLDVERVAPCMPGAEVLERTGEDAYRVGIKVRVGPISMTYRGDVEITQRDEAAHTATLHATAREARGQGAADAQVHMRLAQDAGVTHATLDTDVALSGRVAAMGQGVIADVAGRLVETFAANLAAMLEAGAQRAPAQETVAPAPTQDALPAGRIAASVIAARLAHPRALALTTLCVAVVFLAIGFAIGRAV